MTEEFTYDELIEELREREQPGREFLSSREWARRWHKSISRTKDLLRDLREENRVVVAKRRVLSVLGHEYDLPVYKILPKD